MLGMSKCRRVRSRRLWIGAACGTVWSAATLSDPTSLPPDASAGAVPPRLSQSFIQVAAEQDVFTIPRVPERPLGSQEGPRLKVTSFKLAGVVDRPAYRIKVAEVKSLLDQVMQVQPAEGLTVNQMQEAAGKVADYYHQHGFVLAQAFVPQQEVRNGEVVVQVLEGKLGAITFEGNKSYSGKTLGRPFRDLLGGPVERTSIESALLTLTEYPGLSAFGVLRAGEEVGTTALAVRVQKENPVEFSTQVDNHGSQFAGEYRAQASVAVNNLLGDADRMRAYGLYGFDSSGTKAHGIYGGFDYELPVFSPRDTLRLRAAKTDYTLGGNVDAAVLATNPKGESYSGEIGYRHYTAPSRVWTSSFGVAFEVATATNQALGRDQFKDKLSTLKLDYLLNQIDTRFRGVNQVSLTYSHGFKNLLGSLDNYDPAAAAPASRFGATGKYDKVVLELQRLQRITDSFALAFRATEQYSSDPLVALEQMSVTGPDAVRAYPVAEVLGDKVTMGTVEVIISAPGFANRPAFGGRTWGQVLQFSLFGDVAKAELNGKIFVGQTRDVTVSGYGAALQFNVPNRVFARLDVAKPSSKLTPSDGRDVRGYFRLGFSF